MSTSLKSILIFNNQYNCRWFKKITQMDLLVSASEHAFMIPPVCRAAVSAEIFKSYVAPVVGALARLEESNISNVYNFDGKQPAVSQVSELILDIQGSDSFKCYYIIAQKLLLSVIADKDGGQVKQLVKAAIEFLNFIETAVKKIQETNIISTPELTGQARPKNTDPNSPRGLQNESADSLLRIQTLIEKRKLATLAGEKSSATTRISPKRDSVPTALATGSPAPLALPAWPPVADPSLSSIYENFHIGVTQVWGRLVVQKWKVLLLIMQLRFQCGLRVSEHGLISTSCRLIYYVSGCATFHFIGS